MNSDTVRYGAQEYEIHRADERVRACTTKQFSNKPATHIFMRHGQIPMHVRQQQQQQQKQIHVHIQKLRLNEIKSDMCGCEMERFGDCVRLKWKITLTPVRIVYTW